MPEPLGAQGGGMPELWGLRGGYAGTFGGSGGGMPERLGLRGGYAGTFAGLGGVCRNF